MNARSILVLVAVAWSSLTAADVKTLGARGDGQADDTDAIQRAVDAGGDVRFPSGVYRLTRTIAIDLDKTGRTALLGDGTARIVMAGPGAAFLFRGTHAGSADPEQFKPNVWERQSTPRVDALEIVGAHPEADGIAAAGTMQLTVTRVVVREARHGIRLFERNRNVLISDVHLYHNRGIGVFLDAVNLHQTNITGSHISYNGGGGVVVRGRGSNVRNLHLGNCDIEANMAKDGPPTANVLIDATGSMMGEIAITGCTIQHTANAPGSANIRMVGAGETPATARTPAIPNREGHLTISGNVLSDVQVNIHLQSARGVTITGNTYWMGFQHDLLVEDSANVIVGPNNHDRNPLYLSQAREAMRGGVVFRRSQDCTISGLQVLGARHHESAVLLEDCSRFNVNGITVLDSDGIGLLLRNCANSRVSGGLIRDDREAPNRGPALVVSGGRGNLVSDTVLDRAAKIDETAAIARGVDVVPRSK